MKQFTKLTAFATLVAAMTTGNTAFADPYADSVVSLERVVSGVSGHSTDWDDGDDGSDSLGAPDYRFGSWDTMTALGYDTSTGEGGTLVLAFQDNRCIDDVGADLKFYEAFGSQSTVGNESMLVEVSNDGGANFVMLGEVGPGAGEAGFEMDLAGSVGSVDHIRMTATDVAGSLSLVGADMDAIECLNSVEVTEGSLGTYVDGCDLGSGEDGVDIMEVVATSDGFSIDVIMTLCGPVVDKAKYLVAFDYQGSDRGHRENGRKWHKKRWASDRRHGNHDDDDDDDDNGFGVTSGPDTLNANPRCHSTEDAVAMYDRGRERGVGLFSVEENTLSLRVDYGELGLAMDSEVLLWVKSWDRRRIGDNVPTVEGADRCSKPQVEKEVIAITLQ